MKCSDVQKYLALYDEKLSDEINSQIVRHIESCVHCRKLYSSIEIYKKVNKGQEDVEVPSELESNVLRRIEAGDNAGENRGRTFKYGYGLAAAAVIIIMIFIYSPENVQPTIYEINFSLNSEKKGKGPADMINFEKIDEKIKGLLKDNDAELKSQELNAATGYYNDITVSVPAVSISNFIKELRQISALGLNIPDKMPEADAYTFKINFDMINFTSANIIGDKKDEIVVQFISGAYKGRWVVYERSGSEFDKYQELQILHTDSSLVANYTMESGDFNGDGYDDILLYEYNNFHGLTLRVLINNKDLGLVEADNYSADLKIPDAGRFVSIMPYDTDHNGTDDLLWLSINDSNDVSFTGMNTFAGYSSVKVAPVEGNLPYIFPGDFTNDTDMDVILKQTWNGESLILIGNNKNGFNNPLEFHRSFSGDYYIWEGDYNGDGLSDLFVKDGGPFLPGSFYLIVSAGNGTFEGAPRFKLQYPQIN